MKPYYEEDGCTIYHGDCLEVALAIGTLQSVDALITDPPYCSGGISEASRTGAKGQGLRSENIRRFGWFVGDNMGTAGLSFLLRSIGVVARHVVKSTGSVLIFCDWRMQSAIAPAIESAGLRSQGLIVWDKGSMGLGLGFRTQHELILHFTTGSPEYHNRGTANVLRCERVDSTSRLHQTEKPQRLLARLVQVTSPEGGLVLDPFMGSGTTLRAAKDLGRRAIGIEIEEKYCEIAAKRLAQGVLPL